MLMLLLFIPLWVSEALRAFAWYIILTFNGPLNQLADGCGPDRGGSAGSRA
jgi:spermidine/putrescine transport system permease protein